MNHHGTYVMHLLPLCNFDIITSSVNLDFLLAVCRTIGNLDIKLDFVPPSLINFISRQLIGSGFRFYKKVTKPTLFAL